jgi:hypothetical protein
MNKFFLSSALPENWQKYFTNRGHWSETLETSRKWQNHFSPRLKLMAKAR